MPMKFANLQELLDKLKSLKSLKEIRAYATSLDSGLSYFGGGAFREAFKTELSDGTSLVVKIANGCGRGGPKSIKREIDLWKKIEEADKKYFANILAYDKRYYRWIIMEFLCNFNWSMWHANPEKDSIKKLDVKYEIGDVEGRNFGARKDNTKFPVIYDWGGYQEN